MIKLTSILSQLIRESEINKDKILPYTFDNKSTDEMGESTYVYSFKTPQNTNKYIVQFTSEGAGAGYYERIFSTTGRESNLSQTGENLPFTIYRTVTAITLDFLDRANKDHDFDTLIIAPISDQRSIIVKKFTNDYIAPKYKVEYIDEGGKELVVIKNKPRSKQ